MAGCRLLLYAPSQDEPTVNASRVLVFRRLVCQLGSNRPCLVISRGARENFAQFECRCAHFEGKNRVPYAAPGDPPHGTSVFLSATARKSRLFFLTLCFLNGAPEL